MTRASAEADGIAPKEALRALPSVDKLLALPGAQRLLDGWGRPLTRDALRGALDASRSAIHGGATAPGATALLDAAETSLRRRGGSGPRAVFNLTGTILHTNLGRASLPEAAIEAVATAAGSCALEYDLETGTRGERDRDAETLLCELTGAEAALVVNNNAAALLLALNTFALAREVPVSRGELVEIGGSFRLPELMTRAGAELVEIGTTNRTHIHDYAGALGERTGALLKVHPSNYAIEGFTSDVDLHAMHELARHHDTPLIYDLGSGALTDLARYGLPREPMPQEALRAGADLVTFSGDKLLGGPQAGLLLGRGSVIEALRRNPLRRALRMDKLGLAALAAVLRLYGDETREAQLPLFRQLARPVDAIHAQAQRIAPPLAARLGEAWRVETMALASQIGSGALPVERIRSAGLVLHPQSDAGAGRRLDALARRLRALPTPVIGRIQDDAVVLDLRGLSDEPTFMAQLDALRPS